MGDFSAFVDLVGVRELAKSEPNAVLQHLTTFKDRVNEMSRCLDVSDKIYFFSDSAFVETSNLPRLLDFFENLRSSLFFSRIFFKAAISKGSLQRQDANECGSQFSGAEKKRRASIVQGSFFGHNAAKLYSEQERLKGIAISIDVELQARRAMVPSVFLPEANSNRAICFQDLRYPKNDLGPGVFSEVIDAIEELRSKPSGGIEVTRKLVRYYLPIFVSMAQCIDLSALKATDFDDESILNSKSPLVCAITNQSFRKVFKGVKGFEHIHFAFMGNVMRSQESLKAGVFERLLPDLVENESMFGLLANVPIQLFDLELRKQYREYRRQL